MKKQLILLFLVMSISSFTYAQSVEESAIQLSKSSEMLETSDLIFTDTPEEEIILSKDDIIPPPFDVRAKTTCANEVDDLQNNNEVFDEYYVGSYNELTNALQLVQDGDVIYLTSDVTIKPNDSFPHKLGVWEPFVLDKAITIDGGSMQNKLSLERGLPLELQADITFKNMNLTMIPEVSIKATYIYVSDTKVIFDNVSTDVEERVAGVSDPRPTLVAGTYATHSSCGDQAHIIIKNVTYESSFAAILTGNQASHKTSNTIIDIESESLIVKDGILLCGMNDAKMYGETIINTSSKKISHYEAFKDGGNATLNFKGVSVLPEVTVLNINNVRLSGSNTRVKLSEYSEGIHSIVIGRDAELTFASTMDNIFALKYLGGPGTLVIPQSSTLTLGAVMYAPVVKVREWLYSEDYILDYITYQDEQPGDIVYHVNNEKYIRQNNQLEVYSETEQPFDELNDALVQYLGETTLMDGENQVITRVWKASDNCGNENIFEQTITVDESVALGVWDDPEQPFYLYPNPASTEFYFNYPQRVRSVSIYGANGSLVKHYPRKENYSIDGLSRGIYIINVEHTLGSSKFKVVKL